MAVCMRLTGKVILLKCQYNTNAKWFHFVCYLANVRIVSATGTVEIETDQN